MQNDLWRLWVVLYDYSRCFTKWVDIERRRSLTCCVSFHANNGIRQLEFLEQRYYANGSRVVEVVNSDFVRFGGHDRNIVNPAFEVICVLRLNKMACAMPRGQWIVVVSYFAEQKG